jgi:hypothetical protein
MAWAGGDYFMLRAAPGYFPANLHLVNTNADGLPDANFGAGGARNCRCPVGGVIVEYEDRRMRQRRAKILHNLCDCHLLVVARHQHGDLVGLKPAGLGGRRFCSTFCQPNAPKSCVQFSTERLMHLPR